jgi:hypothetical protein
MLTPIGWLIGRGSAMLSKFLEAAMPWNGSKVPPDETCTSSILETTLANGAPGKLLPGDSLVG